MSFAAHALSHRSYRRRHVIGLGVLVTLLAWACLWGLAAYHLNKTVDKWVEASKTEGTSISFTSRSTDGTPLTIHIHLEQFQLSHTGNHNIKAGEAILYLSLWDWKTITTKLKNEIQGQANGLPFTAEVLKFGFEKPENPPINHLEAGLTLWAQIMGLTLKPQDALPLGNRLDHLSFELRVMGTPPDFAKTDSIRAWNDASGVIEFDQLDLIWGTLGLSAKGTVALSPDLQPEGAFSGKIDGLEQTINTLVSQNIIEYRQQAILRSSISVLARPSSVVGGSAPIVPISVQSGGLFLGPVRVLTIPPIIWLETPAPEEPTTQTSPEPAIEKQPAPTQETQPPTQ